MKKALQSIELCKALWARLGSNLDSPLRIGPVDQFRRGLACGGGSRPDGSTEAMVDSRIDAYTLLMQKKPFKVLNFERLCGPSWARTSDPLIMSQVL